jgi:hypothetical protein
MILASISHLQFSFSRISFSNHFFFIHFSLFVFLTHICPQQRTLLDKANMDMIIIFLIVWTFLHNAINKKSESLSHALQLEQTVFPWAKVKYVYGGNSLGQKCVKRKRSYQHIRLASGKNNSHTHTHTLNKTKSNQANYLLN